MSLAGCGGGPAGGGAARPATDGGAGVPGAAAAPVAFKDVDGLHAELAARRGRPVFVNFWATWCGPCVEEMPRLAALAREPATRGADFVGVSLDAWITGEGKETEEKVRASLARSGVAYPNLIYRGDQDPLANAFHLPGPIPYSILYDARGRAVRTWAGPVGIDDLRKEIAALGSSTTPEATPSAGPASRPGGRRAPGSGGGSGSTVAPRGRSRG